MRLIVVGRPEEVCGFALAGVDIVVCDAAAAAAARVERVSADGAGLVLVTPWIARHAARTIAALQRHKGPPVVSIIPGLSGSP
jgi:vacuolar-type H+-ATPase subunit F/Vma7